MVSTPMPKLSEPFTGSLEYYGREGKKKEGKRQQRLLSMTSHPGGIECGSVCFVIFLSRPFAALCVRLSSFALLLVYHHGCHVVFQRYAMLLLADNMYCRLIDTTAVI